jgi:hypothetical protein
MPGPKRSTILNHKAFHYLMFCGGLLLLLWPMMGTGIQSRVDMLFYYLFTVWGLLIFFLLLTSRAEKDTVSEDSPPGGRE